MRSVLWANFEEAVELLLCELTAAPGVIEPQEDLLFEWPHQRYRPEGDEASGCQTWDRV
jgi:hypothetical protein